jgi:mRNA interferase RelE/StbE
VYQIKTASRRVEREIADLPRQIRERITQAIGDLATDPRPPGVRKLAGEMRGAWRIRVSDYRVLYDIDDDQRVIVILAVLHRREAYR